MAAIPPSGAPSSKEKKYDRQLRLWGANGQNHLEAAHIALFGATATGCELLKNLVLPGVGCFTIIDDKTVSVEDLGTNFFLDEDSVGQSRAERTAALLGELNPDVRGNHIHDSLTNLLVNNPEFFDLSTSPFTHIVVTSPFLTSDITKLSPDIPTFLVHSIGFTAGLRIALPTHTIVETHPDSLVDLRLLNPWPELEKLVAKRTQGLDVREADGGMGELGHGHVPYVLLLLKYLNDWKSSHGGNYPLNYKEKNEFKALIQSKMRTDVAGGSEENYEEAVAAVLKNVREAGISSETKAVFDDERCVEPTEDAENFWIIAHAIREFVQREDQGAGLLPLSGGFPDMKAESNTYVELQNVYRTRANRDATIVYGNVQALLQKLGRDPQSIPFDEVFAFTKHANFVRRINYRPITSEYAGHGDKVHSKAVVGALGNWDAEDGLIHDYIAIRAWQEFCSRNGRAPGAEDAHFEADYEQIMGLLVEYLGAVGYVGEPGDRAVKMAKEVVRTGGGELHVIASLVGGIAAQEITKVITKQYIPVKNTVIFDGIGSRSSVFEF